MATDTCGEGLHMMNLGTPNNPLFAGCHDAARTHETQCVEYRGPDTEHREKEICFSSSQDHFEVADVTRKSAPLTLSSSTYPELGFVHQGWLTEDHRFQANYTSGLRVLEFGDLEARDIREIAFFDTSPGRDDRSFQGAWSVYPYLPSGTLIVSDIGNGLFVLSLE